MGDEDSTKFGCQTVWSEPAWYDSSLPNPYYTEDHVAFRKTMRDFVEEHVIDNVEEWEKDNDTIPASMYIKAAECGLLPATVGWPEGIEGIPPRPKGYDGFMTLIAQDELARCASGGTVWGLTGALGIGLPPVIASEDETMKKRVVGPCIRGEKRIALAVSEATAGSDVANLKTTAEDKGDYYLVEGQKKWITGGLFADFFTTAVRTGDEDSGMFGVELLLIEKSFPGVSVRPMECMGVKGSGTAFVEFDEVKVPKENLLGGVDLLLGNFVTERLGIAVQANRFARCCLKEAIEYTSRRSAFKKKLIDMPVVRHKIAHMAREVSVTHAYIESLAYRLVALERKGDLVFGTEAALEAIMKLGADAMLAKVQATKTFEHCAREAAHMHGGNSYVKGNRIESLYRHVLSLAIPGGSEDVMIDAAARLALKGTL
jgi:alkylation response protein AidB-like acyl-CoA dehydrogenase